MWWLGFDLARQPVSRHVVVVVVVVVGVVVVAAAVVPVVNPIIWRDAVSYCSIQSITGPLITVSGKRNAQPVRLCAAQLRLCAAQSLLMAGLGPRHQRRSTSLCSVMEIPLHKRCLLLQWIT